MLNCENLEAGTKLVLSGRSYDRTDRAIVTIVKVLKTGYRLDDGRLLRRSGKIGSGWGVGRRRVTWRWTGERISDGHLRLREQHD